MTGDLSRVTPKLVDDPRTGLGLRPWQDGDVGYLVQAWSEPDIAGQAEVPGAGSVADALRWIAAADGRDAVDLAIVDRVTPEVVWGEVGLAPLSLAAGSLRRQEVEVGWWVLPDHRGRGVARTAARLLVEWALSEGGLALPRVVARIDDAHAASQAVARAAGLTRLGSLGAAGEGRSLWVRVAPSGVRR